MDVAAQTRCTHWLADVESQVDVGFMGIQFTVKQYQLVEIRTRRGVSHVQFLRHVDELV